MRKFRLLIISLFLFTSSNVFALGINDGLIGWWKLDEGSGTSTYDSSGNGHTGTISGSTWSVGKRNAALRFTSGDYVDVGNRQGPQTAATFAAWINLADTTSIYQIIMQYSCGLGRTYMQFFVFGGNLYGRIQQTTDTVYIGRRTGSVLRANSWMHVAYTWDGGTTTSAIKVYIDGVQSDNADDAAGSFTAPYAGSDVPIYIGKQGCANVLGTMLVDDVRIYNRALTASEIAMLANNRNQIKGAGIINGSIR